MASLLSNEAVQPDPVPESMLLSPQEPTLMPLPPLATYNSQDGLFESIQAWSKQHNYCFRVGRSKTINSGSRKKVFYECTHCGPIPSVNRLQDDAEDPQDNISCPRDRIRSTSTSKTGCQFSVIGVQVNESLWELQYRPDPKFSVHNHRPSD